MKTTPEGKLLALWQRSRPVGDYIHDFRRLSDKLRGRLERLMVHQFKTGLDRMVRQDCVYRGLPPRLGAWYQASTKLEVELRDFRQKD